MTPEERAEAVLSEVDDIAREYDRYEYGLPTGGKYHRRMVACVAAAIREAIEAHERANAIANGERVWPEPTPAELAASTTPGPAARPDYPPGKVVHLIDAVGGIVCGTADPTAEAVGFPHLANCPECLAVMPGATPAPAAPAPPGPSAP